MDRSLWECTLDASAVPDEAQVRVRKPVASNPSRFVIADPCPCRHHHLGLVLVVVVAHGRRNRANCEAGSNRGHTRGVPFSHQRLAVYQRSIDFVAWSHELLHGIDAPGSARLQLERASTSIPLNIAEGNVKSSPRDRRRYWEIALGSTAECAAILDVLVARRLLSEADVAAGLDSLERIVSMLVRLVQTIDEDGRVGRQRRRGRGDDQDKDNDKDQR